MPAELDLADLAARATAAAQAWAPGCVVSDVQPLTGGASSLTFTALVAGGPADGERIVLKVAPPGLEPVRNRDVARQARLMRALDGAPGVRVPWVYFEDDGAPPEVSPFHAMNIVPGECLEPILQQPPADVLPLVPDRAFAAAAMLAALHRVDPDAVGLGGEKRTSLEDEIKRWTRAFETVDERMNRGTSRPRSCCSRPCRPRSPMRSATVTIASATCCVTVARSPKVRSSHSWAWDRGTANFASQGYSSWRRSWRTRAIRVPVWPRCIGTLRPRARIRRLFS